MTLTGQQPDTRNTIQSNPIPLRPQCRVGVGIYMSGNMKGSAHMAEFERGSSHPELADIEQPIPFACGWMMITFGPLILLSMAVLAACLHCFPTLRP